MIEAQSMYPLIGLTAESLSRPIAQYLGNFFILANLFYFPTRTSLLCDASRIRFLRFTAIKAPVTLWKRMQMD